MSTLKIGALKNNGSAVALPNGVKVGGNEIIQGYTSSGTEPTSPAKGDFWWDSTNELLYQYANGVFKAIGITVPVITWTVALSSVTYDSVSFSVASQETAPRNVVFNLDGTKMYMVGRVSDAIHQYSLSTGFDISTASYDSVSFSIFSQTQSPTSISVNSDGTKFYVVGSTNIYQYSLSTAFDISTASYSVTLSVSSQDSTPANIAFNTDGTKMYMVGWGGDAVYQYSLSTGFDINTASYDSVSFSVASQAVTPAGVKFNTDGTKMYVLNLGTAIYQYSLSTGFDISTASYDSVSFVTTNQDTTASGLVFSTDGSKLYLTGYGSDAVYQYSTGL